jgi:predicted TIM-barrel fold metal-dependent hydrolase
VEAARALPISDAAKRKLLWDNPAALYGLRGA